MVNLKFLKAITKQIKNQLNHKKIFKLVIRLNQIIKRKDRD